MILIWCLWGADGLPWVDRSGPLEWIAGRELSPVTLPESLSVRAMIRIGEIATVAGTPRHPRD